jgi:uncharacterized protein (DUF983 family)
VNTIESVTRKGEVVTLKPLCPACGSRIYRNPVEIILECEHCGQDEPEPTPYHRKCARAEGLL